MATMPAPAPDRAFLAEPAAKATKQYRLQRVAVLGAGTMGARIAVHIANAGLPVLLLDMVPASGGRNELGNQAMSTLKSSKPAVFASAAAASLVSIGNFDDDLAKLKDCDWVIEAVAENLDIKRVLLAKVAQNLHPTAILTTNTSGLPVAKIAEQLPEGVRRRWFGTHFFNPPRYMRLLEIIPTSEADPEAVRAIGEFEDRQLGKEVVPANDVQNFIANRVGTFAMLNTFKIMQEQGLTIEEVDLLTGQAIGWPKSGTFRLADMVGIDVLGNVARNFLASATDERPDVILPDLISQMMERKWLGDKTKQGFYKKDKGACQGRGHRRQLLPDLGRRGRSHRHVRQPRERDRRYPDALVRCIRVCRLPAGVNGNRPYPRDPEGAQTCGPDTRRDRPDRTERGVRHADARHYSNAWHGPGTRQCERRSHCAWPSDGLHGSEAYRNPGARDEAAQLQVRHGDHVRWRRSRRGRHLRKFSELTHNVTPE